MIQAKTMLLVLLSAALSGCTIGNWNICGPQTPRANCDREAYERLVHSPPYSDYWEKPDATPQRRRADWVECGGMANGNFSSGPSTGRSAEDDRRAHKEKHDQLKACMQSQGYKRVPPEKTRP